MALRQMGIARMGNYRPRWGVNEGGKTGRPKLLHNGTGHGLTGGGGLNAKGTGGGIKVSSEMKPMQRQLRKSKYQSNKFNAIKINEREKNRVKRADMKTKTVGGTAVNPHPTGSFQYGHNQWGHITNRGMVDWTREAPVKGAAVIGFDQALPWLRKKPAFSQMAQQYLKNRKAPPAWYIDPLYTRQMAAAKLIQDRENADISHQRAQQQLDYTTSNEQLVDDYDQNVDGANAQLGQANIAGSGIASAQLGQLAEALGMAKSQNQRQRELQDTQLNANLALSENAFNVTKSAEQGVAKERWQATHQGQKAPKPKIDTRWTENGRNMYANKQGIPMTVSAKKPAKPKFPGAKTFKNAKGEVKPVKGKK